MALNSSFPIVETGNNSPHGEMFRLVYNKEILLDACEDPVWGGLVAPIGAVPYWYFPALLVDGPQPFSGTFPPAAPRAATHVAEAYIPVAGLTPGHFPVTPVVPNTGAHQNNLGVCSYAAMGVGQYNVDACGDEVGMKIGMPAGVVVCDNVAGAPMAITGSWPDACDHDACGDHVDWLDRLYIVKTRGIVQARVDGLCDAIAVGNYLEGQAGSWDLILDAANANEGTFIALEAAVVDNRMIWVMCVNLVY